MTQDGAESLRALHEILQDRRVLFGEGARTFCVCVCFCFFKDYLAIPSGQQLTGF